MMRRKLRQGKPRCNGSSGPMEGPLQCVEKASQSFAARRRRKKSCNRKVPSSRHSRCGLRYKHATGMFAYAAASGKHFARSERRIVATGGRPRRRAQRDPFGGKGVSLFRQSRAAPWRGRFFGCKVSADGIYYTQRFQAVPPQTEHGEFAVCLHGKIKTRGTMEEKKTVQTEVEKPRDRAVLAGLSSPGWTSGTTPTRTPWRSWGPWWRPPGERWPPWCSRTGPLRSPGPSSARARWQRSGSWCEARRPPWSSSTTT